MSQKSVKKATARAKSAKRKSQKATSKTQSAESKVQSIESRIEQSLSQLSSLNSELSSLNSELCRSSKPQADGTPASIPPPNPILAALLTAIADLVKNINDLQSVLNIDTNLTGRERARLIGVKSRNYGFIVKSFDIIRDNPDFGPPNFELNDMMKNLVYLENSRQLTMLIEQLRHLADDFLLTTCDTAYRDALRIYGSLREQSRNRVPGADALFQQLLQFFTLRRRRPGEEEPTQPTEHELERDYKRLIHGKADGQMTVKHVSPHVVGGLHEVVDDVHQHRGSGVLEVEVGSK